MNKTLNNITDKLEELAEAHNMVNGFAVGDIANIGNDTQKDDSVKLEYPYVWIDYDSITQGIGQTRGTQFLIYTLRLVVLDKYTPSSKNTMEVMSDTAGILNDFIQYISTHSDLKEFRLSGSDVQILPVRDNEKDGAEGWTALVPFKIPYQFCATNLPVNPFGNITETNFNNYTYQLRSATFNTYLGIGTLGSSKYESIKKHILRVQPDVLTLNEMTTAARSLIDSNLASEVGMLNVAHATGGNNPEYNPSIISKYPILNSRVLSSPNGGNEFRIEFLFTELDISSIASNKTLGVYSIHATPFSLNGGNEAIDSAPYLEFERAVQFKRLADDIESTRNSNPNMVIIVQGDHNEDNLRNQTASFSSVPSGIGITLGSDIVTVFTY